MDHTPYKSTGYTPIKDYFRLWILANFEELWFTVYTRAVSISLFQFRYDIDTIFTKYRDIDIDIK